MITLPLLAVVFGCATKPVEKQTVIPSTVQGAKPAAPAAPDTQLFFNRVRRAVAEHWKPDVENRRRGPAGNVYGAGDRITVLRVSLRPDGSLANVIVEQPSGVDFLDDQAIEALKGAGPFPNPPRQLMDKTGMIQFRFDFVFQPGEPDWTR